MGYSAKNRGNANRDHEGVYPYNMYPIDHGDYDA